MKATTSGPTPTPAAATVAACSTSRLMPSRNVSLPARRMTYRSASPATVIRKLRFVIPPESGMKVSVASGRLRDALERVGQLLGQLTAERLVGSDGSGRRWSNRIGPRRPPTELVHGSTT